MRKLRLALPFVIGVALVSADAGAEAQEIEPRAYSNAPIGSNFFIAGYTYSIGGLSVDPELPVEGARLQIHSGVLAYARALDLWGKSGKFDVVLPFSTLSGTATVAGRTVVRTTNGVGDLRFRLSANLFGARALSLRKFAGYKRDLVVGTSVQLSAPCGEYDPTKAVNLGTNRWSARADFGMSKGFGALTLDFTTSATFYTYNDDYFGGKTLEQLPVFAWQGNLSYDFGSGVWGAAGATYYFGGRTTVDGVVSSADLGNLRMGAFVVLPASRSDSFKLGYSRGVYTPTGTDFSVFALAWQYRWNDKN